MTEFDREKFENKYAHYFTELQRAYKNAFETMNDTHDSELVHAIDQQILNESEPFYEEGAFHVDLPSDPAERVTAVSVADDTLDEVLDRYVAEIEAELYHVFDMEPPSQG